MKSISDADRKNKEFAKFVSAAEDELAVAEEAIKLGRFAAATESLDNGESALDELRKARFARKEAARKAKEEAERRAREKAEVERRARKEAARKARGDEEHMALEEASHKAGELQEIMIGG